MDIDFLYIMSVSATITLAFILYRLLIEENTAKTKDHYTRPEYVLNGKKKQQLKLMRELRNYEIEAPKILPNDNSSDSQKFFGSDHEGNSFLIKFTRRRHRIAEVWLILRLKSGQQYTSFTLPDHPHTKICNATPRVFEGAGLKLECLVPYSRWRITYIGMLRKGISQNLSKDESNYHFARLNFIWQASNNPLFWPYEWSTSLMATALATEQWRDGKWKNLINLKDSGGYGQFGAAKGEVRIYENNYIAYREGQLPKVKTLELNFPGIRQRRWGPHKNEHLHRTGVILGNMKDGTVIEVGALSSKIGVTHSQFGNIRVSNGNVLPIEWTDFHLASLGEYQDQLPEATIIQIEAGGKAFIAVVTFRNQEKVPLFGGSVGERWNAFVVPVDIMCNTVRGFGCAVFWYPRNIRHFEIEEFPTEIKRIFHRMDAPSPDKQVISFADKEASAISVSGGKGCSLAILRIIQETKDNLLDHRGRNFQVLNALVDQFSGLHRSAQFSRLMNSEPPKTGRQRSGSITKTIFPDPNDDEDMPEFFVPQGFIISVSAFNEHLKKHIEIRRAIEELKAVAYEKITGSLEEACANVQKAFNSTSISDELRMQILPKLNQINFDAGVRFAVRSSGLTEDSDELSSAGQNQTFLGLRTNEEVFDAIVRCWSSLFSFQSVFYRKQNIQPVASSMAVVVQKMIHAESAGVLFSRHFLNGDPSVIVITANFGLGESVVSGKFESDTYLVRRDYKGENVSLLATIVGDKKFKIEMDSDTAVKEVELGVDKRKELCLSEDIVLKLAKLAINLEKFFGTPRDIEFAITKDKKIYLLQSRSITALNNFTDYEIIHETDTAVMSGNDIYTRANVGEVLNGGTSHISQSLVTHRLEKIHAKNFKTENYSLYQKFFGTFSNHVFMDVYQIFLGNLSDKVNLRDIVMSFSVFGGDIFKTYPQLIEIARHRNSFKSSLLRDAFLQLKILFYSGYFLNDYMRNQNEALEKLKNKLSDKNLGRFKTSSDICNHILRELENFDICAQSHLMASSNSVLVNMLAFAVLTHGAKELTIEHQRDITLVLQSIGDIESANIPEMLREISESIKSSGFDREFLDISDNKAIQWLKNNAPNAYNLFEKFLERHGHRALREFDMSTETWEMQPEQVVKMLKASLSFSSPTVRAKKTLEPNDVMSQIKTPLTSIRYKMLKRLMGMCHKGVRTREEAKSKLIKAIDLVRKAVISLSQKMVNEGLLPDKELIFYLQLNEVKAIIKNRDSLLVNKAVRRKKMMKKIQDYKFDEICFGIPRPLNEQSSANFDVKEGDIIVRGMPVCNGVVTARACVINNFKEIDKLERGDILITYSTDIAWSPYFNLLSGLCTEIGGLISHGAVVARECGLPCIVGANRATDRIKTGDQITLNASEGIITK